MWRRFVSWFFYFKDCWGHHRHAARCPVARWHCCSCRAKFSAGSGCLGPSWVYSGYGSPTLIPLRMTYGMCQHEQRNAPLGGGNPVITILPLQSPPCHQEHPRGNPETALPKSLEMLLSCCQLLQHISSEQGLIPRQEAQPKHELSQKGLASLGGTRGGGLLGGDAEGGPVLEAAGGWQQPPLPHTWGGQRSSRHQREGLCVTPSSRDHRQCTTVVFELSWNGAAL